MAGIAGGVCRRNQLVLLAQAGTVKRRAGSTCDMSTCRATAAKQQLPVSNFILFSQSFVDLHEAGAPFSDVSTFESRQKRRSLLRNLAL